MPLTWIIYVVVIALPFVSYGYAVQKTKYEVRSQERAACTLRIAEIEKKINADADAKIKAALEAAAAESQTPEAPEEIAALCSKDAACRDRNQ